MKQRLFPTLLVAICIPYLDATARAQASANDPALQRLEREITRLAGLSDGVVGVAVTHLETGRKVSLRHGEKFPMASAFKVPIAVQLLSLVDRGKIQLDQIITLKPNDLHPGSGTLTDLFNKPGVALSVRNLMELMLLISDNSAADVLLRLAGGPQEVSGRMRALGIEGIRVDRSTAQLIADWGGVTGLPPESEWTPELFRRLLSAVPEEKRRAAALRADEDPRDTSTPEAMALVLERIHRKDLLEKESAEMLLDIMLRCRTGETRLKGILPAGTSVAHKTGTIGGTTNDVGIVTLPDNAGHVAIAVFVKSSAREVSTRERIIAAIARAAHDFFLFLP